MAKVDMSEIASFPVFSGAPRSQVEAVVAEARLVSHAKGEEFFRQGEPAHSFWLLLDGRLQAVKLTPEGQQVVVRYLGPGEFFGIAVAMGLSVYPGTSIPIVSSTALIWPSTFWTRMIELCPPLAAGALQSVGARLHEAHTRVIEMSTERVEQRVAKALLRLAQQAGRTVDLGVAIDFPISRQDVAEMTGTTLHTVSRILSAWESRGIVGGGRQRIVIQDTKALSELAGTDVTQGARSPD